MGNAVSETEETGESRAINSLGHSAENESIITCLHILHSLGDEHMSNLITLITESTLISKSDWLTNHCWNLLTCFYLFFKKRCDSKEEPSALMPLLGRKKTLLQVTGAKDK